MTWEMTAQSKHMTASMGVARGTLMMLEDHTQISSGQSSILLQAGPQSVPESGSMTTELLMSSVKSF